jgi:septum formation protein
MTRLVLASASPARLSLLRRVGIDPTVCVSEVDEEAVTTVAEERAGRLEAADVALVLARAKAEDVCRQLAGVGQAQIVLGCDSVLELDGVIHGKPATDQEAIERWQQMRGRTGVLHTGHWLVDERPTDQGGTAGTLGATASTAVTFADLTDGEIAAYVATGEPRHVAGAFTIDGLGAAFVTGIEGDPSNVVGLSLPLLRELLRDLKVGWFDLAQPPVTP